MEFDKQLMEKKGKILKQLFNKIFYIENFFSEIRIQIYYIEKTKCLKYKVIEGNKVKKKQNN